MQNILYIWHSIHCNPEFKMVRFQCVQQDIEAQSWFKWYASSKPVIAVNEWELQDVFAHVPTSSRSTFLTLPEFGGSLLSQLLFHLNQQSTDSEKVSNLDISYTGIQIWFFLAISGLTNGKL